MAAPDRFQQPSWNHIDTGHSTPFETASKGSDALYCESVLRLPDGYACYAPPADAPEVNELPALSNGYVTFGCLNNPGKLNLAVFEVFASVLVEVPQSRLLFRFRGMDDPAVNEPIIKTMADLGINAHRMTFEGQAPHSEFLNTYNRIDIALDTFPYSGGLTTCEALWMGTPTITFPGLTFAGRHATSHLHAAGCPEYVANDREKMIEMAVSLANDWDALPEIRTGMRAKIQGSSLCDGHRFAESFAATMRQAWTAWCVQEPDATS